MRHCDLLNISEFAAAFLIEQCIFSPGETANENLVLDLSIALLSDNETAINALEYIVSVWNCPWCNRKVTICNFQFMTAGGPRQDKKHRYKHTSQSPLCVFVIIAGCRAFVSMSDTPPSVRSSMLRLFRRETASLCSDVTFRSLWSPLPPSLRFSLKFHQFNTPIL